MLAVTTVRELAARPRATRNRFRDDARTGEGGHTGRVLAWSFGRALKSASSVDTDEEIVGGHRLPPWKWPVSAARTTPLPGS